MGNFIRIYLLPGIVLQSLIVSGGYATGQELVQFFLLSGPMPGLLGLCATMLLWAICCALSFYIAVVFKTYDYKAFFKVLLGRAWFLYEVCYFYLLVIVCSVVSATAANMLLDLFGLPLQVGGLLVLAYVFIMVISGGKTIAKVFSMWSLLLYVVFAVFLVSCYHKFNSNVLAVLTEQSINLNLIMHGLQKGIIYAGYNLGAIPALLGFLIALKTPKQAVVSGLIAGVIAIVPAFMLYFALLTDYPNITNVIIPSTFLLNKIDIPVLTILYSIVLLGTLIETGVGLTHAFYAKLSDNFMVNRKLIIISFLSITFVIAQFGLINLIAKGYTILTVSTIAVFFIPLITVGVYKLSFSSSAK